MGQQAHVSPEMVDEMHLNENVRLFIVVATHDGDWWLSPPLSVPLSDDVIE